MGMPEASAGKVRKKANIAENCEELRRIAKLQKKEKTLQTSPPPPGLEGQQTLQEGIKRGKNDARERAPSKGHVKLANERGNPRNDEHEHALKPKPQPRPEPEP